MKPTTKSLIDGINMDIFPNFAAQVDFGIRPSENPTTVFGALQRGYRLGLFSAADLDRASCDGRALTELVNRGNNPYGKNLTIKTTWDDLPEEDDDEDYYEEDLRCHALSDQEELPTT